MIAPLLTACTLTPASVAPPLESLQGFAMEARGRTLAGVAAVSARDERWQLDALLPTGTTLFSVAATPGEVAVDAPDPGLADLLRRVPFDRDLALLFGYRCEARRCSAGPWRLARRDDGWAIRGPGGPARVREEGALRVLHDPIRGYRLKVHAP